MKRRKISKLIGLLGAAFLSLGVFVTPGATLTTQAAAPPEVQPCTPVIGWVYMIVEGRVYKCLYNYSTGEYIGEWIYVGPYITP